MPVIPDIDPATATLSEMQEYLRASAEHRAVVSRNIKIAEAGLASGQTSFPMAECQDCGERMPIRDDGTAECPNHGVLTGPDQ